ncbi:MAG: PspC domain-containing protein [Anaerolineae bacterium]
MYRSFTDRIFGGVCGGLGAILPFSAWTFRVAFVVLSLITLGVFGALYVLLWWIIPQESLTARRRGGSGRLLLVIILTVAAVLLWLGALTGTLVSASGQSLLWPIIVAAMCVTFFLKQVRP